MISYRKLRDKKKKKIISDLGTSKKKKKAHLIFCPVKIFSAKFNDSYIL